MSRALLAGMLVGLLPGTGQAQDWWQGIWTSDPQWCVEAEHIGAVNPAPIAITADEVLDYENSCEISEVHEMHAAGAVHLRLKCQAEGSRFDEDRVVMRTDETGLAIWIWFGSGDPLLFQRCE